MKSNFKTCRYAKKSGLEGVKWCSWYEIYHKVLPDPLKMLHSVIYNRCDVREVNCVGCLCYRRKNNK